MGTKGTVKHPGIVDPKWSVAEAEPGQEVELSVTVKKIEPNQQLELRIKDGHGTIAILRKPSGSGTTYKAKWTVPNTLGKGSLTFDAILREEPPTPKNDHLTSRGRATSGKLAVHGFKVSIDSADVAFVPSREKLHAKILVESTAKRRARCEIWGERYPTKLPLYTEDFDVENGKLEWSSWKGSATDGPLAGKFITPEFSPYRLRVIVGVDQASVADAEGAGKGKVCVAEWPFEVVVDSLVLRLQTGLGAATRKALDRSLVIEPKVDATGAYADKGRLPAPSEKARLRIPNAMHNINGEPLDQGGDDVGDDYLASGAKSKWEEDGKRYSRPEIPLEIEPRLRSRSGGGIFEPAVVGPLVVEPFADDAYDETYFDPSRGGTAWPTVGGSPSQAWVDTVTYWKSAVHKVKLGSHDNPFNTGGKPLVGYWQARIVIGAPPYAPINLASVDPDFVYVPGRTDLPGKSELTVYLDRTRLQVGARGSKADVEEIDKTHVQIRSDLLRAGQVAWIVRDFSFAAGTYKIDEWTAFPPGGNCHVHYGGIRGAGTNNLFLDDFSAPGGPPKQPIIGAGSPWHYKDDVDLAPDRSEKVEELYARLSAMNPAAPPLRFGERVEARARLAAPGQGLAGIIFSPSVIAGDSYVLGAQLAPVPYERTMGFVPSQPRLQVKTGRVTVWRLVTIARSLRAPDAGTHGYPLFVGNPPDATATPTPVYIGDGVNMDIVRWNLENQEFFSEWQVTAPSGGGTFHQDIPAATYIAAHDASSAGGAGKVTIGSPANITNYMVQFDPYRVALPPGVPATDAGDVAAVVSALPAGTTMVNAMNAVVAAGVLGKNNGGYPSIIVYPGSRDHYDAFIEGVRESITQDILDSLTPQQSEPTTMSVVRWPRLYQEDKWTGGAPDATNAYDTTARVTGANITFQQWNGFALGSGQSYFSAGYSDPGVFPHEMAHTLKVIHFTAGNFGWKHHHLRTPDCRMSYRGTTGNIPMPDDAVGPTGFPAANVDTGWPDPDGTGWTIAISLLATATHGALPDVVPLCAKCGLKIRGWKDELLPVAWAHPDLF